MKSPVLKEARAGFANNQVVITYVYRHCPTCPVVQQKPELAYSTEWTKREADTVRNNDISWLSGREGKVGLLSRFSRIKVATCFDRIVEHAGIPFVIVLPEHVVKENLVAGEYVYSGRRRRWHQSKAQDTWFCTEFLEDDQAFNAGEFSMAAASVKTEFV
jgi:hypothetical protein